MFYAIICFAFLGHVQAAVSQHQIFLDVQEANTTWHLEAIRALPLSNYRLSYERSKSDR